VWSKGREEARDSKRRDEMLWMWGGETQEVGVSKDKREKERGSGTPMKSVEEGEGAQWSKWIAPKGSSNVHGGVDDTQRSGDLHGMQGV